MCSCVADNKPVARMSRGGAYLKNRDHKVNVGMIRHASSEDASVLGGSGGMVP